MVTAMQSAKLRACDSLIEARKLLLDIRWLVCWADGDRRILTTVSQIDDMLEEVLPSNKGPQ